MKGPNFNSRFRVSEAQAREQKVVQLITQGVTPSAIRERLGLTHETYGSIVRKHGLNKIRGRSYLSAGDP